MMTYRVLVVNDDIWVGTFYNTRAGFHDKVLIGVIGKSWEIMTVQVSSINWMIEYTPV